MKGGTIMEQQQLNAIKQRITKAKEGPWSLGKKSPNGLNNIGVKGCMLGQVFGDGNAEFIAHAHEDVPTLVAEVEKLREALEFYADETKYEKVELYDGDKEIYIERDGGETARLALNGEARI